jgi:prepilin signal peptidase PulO-like enzyme (type II secretory pathway)
VAGNKVAATVIVFLFTGQAPPILIVALLILVYLTGIDLWREDLPLLVKAWWVLLVLLLNLVGYVAFRVWLAVRGRRRQA